MSWRRPSAAKNSSLSLRPALWLAPPAGRAASAPSQGSSPTATTAATTVVIAARVRNGVPAETSLLIAFPPEVVAPDFKATAAATRAENIGSSQHEQIRARRGPDPDPLDQPAAGP